MTRSTSRAIGVLCTAHEFGADQIHPRWLTEHREQVAAAASRVEVRHDPEQTRALARHLLEAAGPLFSGVTAKEIRAAFSRAQHEFDLPGAHSPLSGLLFRRTLQDPMLENVLGGTGDLAQMDERAFRYHVGADVKLYTTRGGWWPECRTIPEGSPGWDWDATIESVFHTHAQGDDARRERGADLFNAPASTRAASWVRRLLE